MKQNLCHRCIWLITLTAVKFLLMLFFLKFCSKIILHVNNFMKTKYGVCVIIAHISGFWGRSEISFKVWSFLKAIRGKEKKQFNRCSTPCVKMIFQKLKINTSIYKTGVKWTSFVCDSKAGTYWYNTVDKMPSFLKLWGLVQTAA